MNMKTKSKTIIVALTVHIVIIWVFLPWLVKKGPEKGCTGNLKFPTHLVRNDSWSAVDHTNNAFVFSAYIENADGIVTLIGASTHSIKTVYCQYWHIATNSHKMTLHVYKATVRLLPENHSNRYYGAMFQCPAPSFNVQFVSLVTEQCKQPLHILVIHTASQPQTYERKFTVCLKPLHFRYGRAYEMVEWIELNRIIGAEKFIIYNFSSAENVGEVLNSYVKQGVVELVQWNLPMTSYTWPRTKPVEIHSIGMLPMLQDCLYRNKKHSEFVVNIDVDEFIVPHSNDTTTWSEMMTQVVVEADTYLFRNSFFRKEWNNAKLKFPWRRTAEKFKLVTLQKNKREERILPTGTRTKYFTRTTKTKTLMIHGVSVGKSYTVPVEIGLLHHYRNWQEYSDTQARVVDNTVLTKYRNRLLKQVERVWKELPNVKLDIPLPKYKVVE